MILKYLSKWMYNLCAMDMRVLIVSQSSKSMNEHQAITDNRIIY